MKIVFISNFLNHHQLPFCEEVLKATKEFNFIATSPTPEEQLKLGYADLNHVYDFVVCAYDNKEEHQKALRLCSDADVVIIGSAPYKYVKARLFKGKLTFRYSERLYKTKKPSYQLPFRALKYFFRFSIFKNFYLLCASAYTAGDYAKTGNFINKSYKWGYFPRAKKYENPEEMISKKEEATILWAGRLIDWKHPEIPCEIAKKLNEEGCNFRLEIIGNGYMEAEIREFIKNHDLDKKVFLLGAMPPEQVRAHMEKSRIYLFTSNRKEGWGAVLNEAMNSGCAVVVSSAIGSVPYLIKDGKNGYIYKDGDIDDLYEKVKSLIAFPDKSKEIGIKGYKTITEQWNAEKAAQRIIELSKKILGGERSPILYEDGICSKAESIKERSC